MQLILWLRDATAISSVMLSAMAKTQHMKKIIKVKKIPSITAKAVLQSIISVIIYDSHHTNTLDLFTEIICDSYNSNTLDLFTLGNETKLLRQVINSFHSGVMYSLMS